MVFFFERISNFFSCNNLHLKTYLKLGTFKKINLSIKLKIFLYFFLSSLLTCNLQIFLVSFCFSNLFIGLIKFFFFCGGTPIHQPSNIIILGFFLTFNHLFLGSLSSIDLSNLGILNFSRIS